MQPSSALNAVRANPVFSSSTTSLRDVWVYTDKRDEWTGLVGKEQTHRLWGASSEELLSERREVEGIWRFSPSLSPSSTEAHLTETDRMGVAQE